MNTHQKTIEWLLLALLAANLLSAAGMALGCFAVWQALALPPPVEDAEMPVVRYAGFKVYDPVYVALDMGFFERRGVQVEVLGDTLGGPTAIQAVAAGQADAGLSSIPAIVNANAAGLPILGVSDIQSALPGQPLEYYYVRAESEIEAVEDLAGKTVAVNLWYSSFHYTAIMALEQAGLGEEDVDWVLLPFDQQLPALLEGRVDCIGLMEPYNAAALATGGEGIRLLFDAGDTFGSKQFTLHFVNRVWSEYNPDAARGFVAGIVDAVHWIEANPEAAKAMIAKYTGIEARYVPVYHFQEGGRVVMEDVAFWLDYLLDRGDVEADWLTPEMLATNRFNRLAD